MKIYQGHTPADVYRDQLKDLLEAPEVIVSGNRKTRELLNVVTELHQPRHRIQIIPGRYMNPWLALSESLHLLAGRDDVASLLPYNKRIAEFSDDGETLYGSYGARIADQIPWLIERLKIDATDRRAVLSIWNIPDLTMDTKDPPCNDMVMFKLRDELLHMTVHNRSNDLHWGLHAVNLPQFSILQEYLAFRLGVGVGIQTHWSNSLHIYTEGPGAKITERMLEALDDPIEPLESPWLFNFDGLSYDHNDFVQACNQVLDGIYGGAVPFFWFAQRFLAFYRDSRGSQDIKNVIYANIFSDWITAGREFLERPR